MTDLLASWPGGSLEATLKLIGALFIAYAIVLWVSAVVWTYRDVRTRTNDAFSQAVAVLLVGLFNLPGLIVYLVIRPQETIADAYERSLEAEAILHELQLDSNACQTCRRPVESDFNVCPYCKTLLREPCRGCAKPVRTNWAACPYCATDRVAPRPAPAARSAPPSAASAAQAVQPPPRPAPSSGRASEAPAPARTAGARRATTPEP
ncbi:MAG TPA: zinc ribbon domain-containing protein [Dehalococcoidia bacterium]|nr:zinc ribbon domain-containing protein [Dehalococcoidia bacterium]